MKKIIALILFATIAVGTYAAAPAFFRDILVANGLKIGGTGFADSKAALEINSTTKGMLFPRMDDTQRDAISSPPTGLIIYNTDGDVLQQYSGGAWQAVGAGAIGNLNNNAYLLANGASFGTVDLIKAGTDDRVVINGWKLPVNGTGEDDGYLALDSTGELEWYYPGNRRVMTVFKNRGAATVTTDGFVAAPTLTATASSQDSSSDAWLRHVTGTVSGNSSGVISAAFTILQSGFEPDMTVKVRLDPSSCCTSQRIWAGFFAGSPDAVSNPTALAVAAFRFDTAVGTTWYGVTSGGAGGVDSCNTGVTVAGGGIFYTLRIKVLNSGAVRFYINDNFQCEIGSPGSTAPGLSVGLGYGVRVTTLLAAARQVDWDRIIISHR